MIDSLYESVGKEFSKSMLGCVMPLYILYPDIPLYEYIEDPEYFLPLVAQHFIEIEKEDLKEGDLIILSKKKYNHFCIYAGSDKIFHCTKAHSLQVSRLSSYSRFKERFYRYKKCQM